MDATLVLCSVWDLWAPVPGVGGKEGLWDHRGWPRASVPMPLPCMWHSHPTAAPEGPTSLCPGAAGKAQRHGSVWGFPLRLDPCAAVQGSRTFGSRILLCSPLGFLGGNSASLRSKKVEGVFFFLFFQFNVVKMLNIIKSVVIFARNIIYFCFSSAPFSSTTVSGQS